MLDNKLLKKIADALPVDIFHAALSAVLLACARVYFGIVKNDSGKSIPDIASELYQATVYCIEYCNYERGIANNEIGQKMKVNKESGVTDAPFMAFLQSLKCPSELGTTQIAYAINQLYYVCRIPCAGEAGDIDKDLLCIYQSEGPKEGLYSYDDTTFEKIVKAFNRPSLIGFAGLWSSASTTCPKCGTGRRVSIGVACLLSSGSALLG